jgi:hypothetical protein
MKPERSFDGGGSGFGGLGMMGFAVMLSVSSTEHPAYFPLRPFMKKPTRNAAGPSRQPTKKRSISATRAAKKSSCRWISQPGRTKTTSKTAQFAATR